MVVNEVRAPRDPRWAPGAGGPRIASCRLPANRCFGVSVRRRLRFCIFISVYFGAIRFDYTYSASRGGSWQRHRKTKSEPRAYLEATAAAVVTAEAAVFPRPQPNHPSANRPAVHGEVSLSLSHHLVVSVFRALRANLEFSFRPFANVSCVR